MKCKVCKSRMKKKSNEIMKDKFGPNTNVVVYSCTGCNNKKLEYI